MLQCCGEANVTKCVVSTTIRYTHFHWLIYKLKRLRQWVTRTCLKRGCVRSFHERQKQRESEMKGLILIRLNVFSSDELTNFVLCFRVLRGNLRISTTSSRSGLSSVMWKVSSFYWRKNWQYCHKKTTLYSIQWV